MYSDPAAVRAYAKIANVGVEVAKTVPVDFYREGSLDPDRLDGLQAAVDEAVKSNSSRSR